VCVCVCVCGKRLTDLLTWCGKVRVSGQCVRECRVCCIVANLREQKKGKEVNDRQCSSREQKSEGDRAEGSMLEIDSHLRKRNWIPRKEILEPWFGAISCGRRTPEIIQTAAQHEVESLRKESPVCTLHLDQLTILCSLSLSPSLSLSRALLSSRVCVCGLLISESI
jgi:hypothetical protein